MAEEPQEIFAQPELPELIQSGVGDDIQQGTAEDEITHLLQSGDDESLDQLRFLTSVGRFDKQQVQDVLFEVFPSFEFDEARRKQLDEKLGPAGIIMPQFDIPEDTPEQEFAKQEEAFHEQVVQMFRDGLRDFKIF